MSTSTKIPFSAFILALAAAIFNPFLVILGSFRMEWVNPYPIILAVAAGFVAASILSVVWPFFAWRWGVIVSGGWLIFLSLVFVSYCRQGQCEWAPLWEGMWILVAACAGAWLARWWVSERTDRPPSRQTRG